jgi:hypothetical protein
MFSSYYRDIQLLRFNAQTREVYIFVSDELQVIVSSHGLWRFLDETELAGPIALLAIRAGIEDFGDF